MDKRRAGSGKMGKSFRVSRGRKKKCRRKSKGQAIALGASLVGLKAGLRETLEKRKKKVSGN